MTRCPTCPDNSDCDTLCSRTIAPAATLPRCATTLRTLMEHAHAQGLDPREQRDAVLDLLITAVKNSEDSLAELLYRLIAGFKSDDPSRWRQWIVTFSQLQGWIGLNEASLEVLDERHLEHRLAEEIAYEAIRILPDVLLARAANAADDSQPIIVAVRQVFFVQGNCLLRQWMA